MVPDVALLEIFDFYVDQVWIDGWHVCRKWRNAVFGSPRRLKLLLDCKAGTPVRETLDVWPHLPIVVRVDEYQLWTADNIVAALEHNDRIWRIHLFDIPGSQSRQLEEVMAAMQQPFPALTYLRLQAGDETAPVNPDSFLGGSSPHLQTLILQCISFPGLPKLLLSATHLVDLDLRKIPHSGYISPEAMITGLSVLTRLESLFIGFESPRSRPDRKSRRPPPPTRTLLPILTRLRFKGVCEYLEDLVARIDVPLLDKLGIIFFHRLVFDTPQVTQFISRISKFKTHDEARVFFSDRCVLVRLPQTLDGALELGISCNQSDWQLSSLAQVCNSSIPLALIPAVERLYIREEVLSQPRWQDDIESGQWLEFFHPFTAVKTLYISQIFVPRIAPALQQLVRESVAEVLPALQTLFLEEPLPPRPVQETIKHFVVARQLAGRPITVSRMIDLCTLLSIRVTFGVIYLPTIPLVWLVRYQSQYFLNITMIRLNCMILLCRIQSSRGQ
jgi:hypothetical protein